MTTFALWSFLAPDQLRIGSPEGAPLAPYHTAFDVRLDGPVARIGVIQHFRNTTGRSMDAHYLFPLAHQGALCALALVCGERRIEGVVREKEQARRSFERAKAAGRSGTIVEQQRPNLFSLELTNVDDVAEFRVELVVEERLRLVTGRYELVVPTVFTRRFVDPQTVPDGFATDPPRASGAMLNEHGVRAGWTVSIHVEAALGLPLSHVRCRSHATRTERAELARGRVELSLDGGDVLPDRDFVLELALAAPDDILFNLHLGQPASGPTSFLLALQPRDDDPDDEQLLRREMIFVLDRSGSMGWVGRGTEPPMDAARRALKACLRTLRSGDTFNLLAFDDQHAALAEAALPWDQGTLEVADHVLDHIAPRGGTDILGAMTWALTRTPDPARMRIVVFMTDGSVSNEELVLARVVELLGSARVHTFGIGNAPNRALIDGMARRGRGTSQFVLTNEDIEEAVLRFQNSVSQPVLSNLSLSFEPPCASDVLPEQLPDLFAGDALEVVGRLREAGPATVTVTGLRAGGRFARTFELTRPATGTRDRDKDDFITRQWARQRIELLLAREEELSHLAQPIREEIVGLGECYAIVSPYTSLVAVEGVGVGRAREEEPPRVALPAPDSRAKGQAAPRYSAPKAELLDITGGRLSVLASVASEAAQARSEVHHSSAQLEGYIEAVRGTGQATFLGGVLADLLQGVRSGADATALAATLAAAGPGSWPDAEQVAETLDGSLSLPADGPALVAALQRRVEALHALLARSREARVVSSIERLPELERVASIGQVPNRTELREALLAGRISLPELEELVGDIQKLQASRRLTGGAALRLARVHDRLAAALARSEEVCSEVAAAVERGEVLAPHRVAAQLGVGDAEQESLLRADSSISRPWAGLRASAVHELMVNDLITRSEDPRRILNLLILDLKDLLADGKKQTAAAIRDEKRSKKHMDEALHYAHEWEKKAMASVRAGRDDLAKDALRHKAEHDVLAADHRRLWEAFKATTDVQRSDLRAINTKLEECKRKKGMLIARNKRTRAQKAIQSTMSGLAESSCFDAFDRMAEKFEAEGAKGEDGSDWANARFDSAWAELDAASEARPSQATAAAPEPISGVDDAETGEQAAREEQASPGSRTTAWDTLSDEARALLRQLAASQRASGAWGKTSDDVLATARAVLTFASAGQTHREGRFCLQLRRAVRFLGDALDTLSGAPLEVATWALVVLAKRTGHNDDVALAARARQQLAAHGGGDGLSVAIRDARRPSDETLATWWS